MISTSAAFLAAQKAYNVPEMVRITIDSTDVTNYVERGSISRIQEMVEDELNAFKTGMVTMRVSNHDETFFNGVDALFDDLSSEIALKIEMGIQGVTDFGSSGYATIWQGLVECDTINRIRENLIEFTSYGYARKAEAVPWTHGTPMRKTLHSVLTQIAADLSLSLGKDITPIDTESSELATTYLQEGSSGIGVIRWTVLDPNIHTNSYHVAAIVNQGPVYHIAIDTSDWSVTHIEMLAEAATGYEYKHLWYYGDYFWTLRVATSTGLADRIYRMNSVASNYTTITSGSWKPLWDRFYRESDKLWFVEELVATPKQIRARYFDMDTQTTTEYTPNTGGFLTWGPPIYDEANAYLRIPLYYAAGDKRWAYFNPSTDTWNTGSTNDFPYDEPDTGGKIASENRLYYAWSDATRMWNYGTPDGWTALPTALTHLKECKNTDHLFGWTSSLLLHQISGSTSTLIIRHRTDDYVLEWEPPNEIDSSFYIGVGSQATNPDDSEDTAGYLIPFIMRIYLVPMTRPIKFGTMSLREILEELAKAYFCTVRITPTYIRFWSRDKYDGTFSITTDLYAKVEAERWQYWCDGLRLSCDSETYWEDGTFTVGDKVIEISAPQLQMSHLPE